MVKNVQETTKSAVVLARDVQLAKVLAGNNKKLRERALHRLKKWLELRSFSLPFTELDFMRIWKGLFYSLWMSDKPLVQEECAESISKLVHFNAPSTSLLFFKCGLQTLCNEWFGIDQIRLGKFLLFVRRLVRQGLKVLQKNSWNFRLTKTYNDVLSETILSDSASPPGGLTMHFIEVYLEELAKVSNGDLKLHILTEMLRPFVVYLAESSDTRVISCVKQNIFHHLLKQSDTGLEYVVKFRAWKQEGFPGASIDAMQKQDLSDDEEVEAGAQKENQSLDPRAGHVDVNLPQLKFSSKQIIELLTQHKHIQKSNVKSRKAITSLINDFTELAKGRYPLGVKKLDLPKKDGYSTRTKQAVNRLVKFEQKLLGKTTKRKQKNHDVLRPKKRKLDSELAEFIEKSEGPHMGQERIRPGKKKRKTDTVKVGYQHSFKRNSGTWFVYEADESSFEFIKGEGLESEVNGELEEAKPDKNDGGLTETPDNNKTIFKQSLVTSSPCTSTPTETKGVFAQSEWDLPLKDGEVEIFVPSRKSRALVKNPFSAMKQSPATSGSSKKVKIDLKLNRSQEIHEHVAQIKSSPGIPFDANRRPTKPLLKPTGMSSPINPFYKRKLTL